jgi:hypothetical protein
MALSKSQREAVRMMFGGKCAYCGHELGAKWHVDHVEALQRDYRTTYDEDGRKWKRKLRSVHEPNNRPDNLFPACVPCNLHKASSGLETWRTWLGKQVETARRYSVPFRTAERFGMVAFPPSAPIVFWFEKFNAEAPHA